MGRKITEFQLEDYNKFFEEVKNIIQIIGQSQ